MFRFTFRKNFIAYRKAVPGALLLIMLISAGCGSAGPTAAETAEPTASQAAQAAEVEMPTAEPTFTPAPVLPAPPAGRPEGGAPGGGMGPATTAQPQFADVAYASVSPAQVLDIYLPEGDGPFPLVILIHGGGFMMGDKSDASGADQLLAAGYAVASVNYRLSSESLAPAQIEDLKAAVRFLRANAAQYKLNSEKFAAWGGSAGGSLAALLGTSCGAENLEGAELGNADQSSCIQAVVDWFGPTDFLQMDEQFTGTSCPANHNDASSPESLLVGGPIQDNPELVEAVNPITYVSENAPAFLIEHGTADCNVPPQQSQLLYDALSSTIGTDNVSIQFIEGAGHGGSEFWTDSNVEIVFDFLAKYLK